MAVGKLRACASSQPHHRQGETLYKVSREISLYQIQVYYIKIHLRTAFRFFAMWLHIFASFLCSKKLSDFVQILYIFYSQQGKTSCWKQILKFKPRSTTFYFIKTLQEYEATSQKNKKVSLNGF